jgi:hypothetical protein
MQPTSLEVIDYSSALAPLSQRASITLRGNIRVSSRGAG